jgi:hypothetical protein
VDPSGLVGSPRVPSSPWGTPISDFSPDDVLVPLPGKLVLIGSRFAEGGGYRPTVEEAMKLLGDNSDFARTFLTALMISPSETVYSLDSLAFELKLRKAIVENIDIPKKACWKFQGIPQAFTKSQYWQPTADGFGITLSAEGLKAPKQAILDLTHDSSQSRFDCNTALQVIYLASIIDVLDGEVFDRNFRTIELNGGTSEMKAIWLVRKEGAPQQEITKRPYPAYYPGDWMKIKCPWGVGAHNGENVIYICPGYYYGFPGGTKSYLQWVWEISSWKKERTLGINERPDIHLEDHARRVDFQKLQNMTK